MCHRFAPLTVNELNVALRNQWATGHARVPHRPEGANVPDAYPGTQVPLFVPDGTGRLVPQALTWGFARQQPDKASVAIAGRSATGGRSTNSSLVFNTRIETALEQARSGRGMWAETIEYGRCLVPARAFWEWWTAASPNATYVDEEQHTRRHQVRYRFAGHTVFLMAGVQAEGRFSVVTTTPNADVSPVHNRMPLVLGPGESSVWLGSDWPALVDRSHIRLTSVVDDS